MQNKSHPPQARFVKENPCSPGLYRIRCQYIETPDQPPYFDAVANWTGEQWENLNRKMIVFHWEQNERTD